MTNEKFILMDMNDEVKNNFAKYFFQYHQDINYFGVKHGR